MQLNLICLESVVKYPFSGVEFMSLPKGTSNSGIKNLKSFPKGKSGYHFKKQKRECGFCEKEYITTVEHSKYCSPKCRDRMRPSRQPRGCHQKPIECLFCEEEFLSKGRSLTQKFCSRQCSGMFLIATGDLNYVYKALIFFENKCNRCGIDDDKVLCVHHIDHDRKNNDLSNLEIVCANCHHKHHYERGKTRRKKIEAIKEFFKNHPEWSRDNADFKRC